MPRPALAVGSVAVSKPARPGAVRRALRTKIKEESQKLGSFEGDIDYRYRYTVDSKKLEHGCRMVYAGFPSLVSELQDGHVPTFWLPLHESQAVLASGLKP